MSDVDPTVPVQGSPTTQSVRDNFSTIKSELEAFQSTATTSAGAALVKTKAGGSTGTFYTGATERTQQAKNDDIVSIKDFGGVGDGVTNDTTAWTNAIAASSVGVYLPAGTYLTTLTKPPSVEVFGPGTLQLNNGDLIYGITDKEAHRGLDLSNARRAIVENIGLVSDQKCIIRQESDGTNNIYRIHRHLGGNKWVEVLMTNNGQVDSSDTPWKVTQQVLTRTYGYLLVGDATKTVDVGPWASVTSGSSTPYTGHQGLNSATTSDKLTLTLSGVADVVEINLIGRTAGGNADITVDGGAAQTIDTYNANDLTGGIWTEIARDLDSTDHTITVEVKGTKNASSSGFNVLFSAIRWRSKTVSSVHANYQAKPWAPSTVYAAHDEVQGPTGLFYYTAAGGTSGSSPPVHTSSSASDGGVTWAVQAASSFDAKRQTIQVAGSEMEYAYQVVPTGQSGLQDVGGNVHGNEYVTIAPQIFLDGDETTLTANTNYRADTIAIMQTIKDYWGTKGSGETNVADVVQVHEFTPQKMTVSYDLTWLTAATVGWFYSAMWPVLAYASAGYTKNLVSISTPRATEILADNESATVGILRNRKDFIMEADGRAFVEQGASGTPTSDNGEIGLKLALYVSADGVGLFEDSNENNAGIAPNLNSGAYTGFSSWLAKMYFQRIKTAGVTVAANDTFKAENVYYIKLHPNNLDVSAL